MGTVASALFVALLVLSAPAVHAGTDPAAACIDAKAKAAGKKAGDLLKAFGKNLKKPDPAKLSTAISKAQSKLTKAFVKAEGKGGCATLADVATMEAKVDTLVADAVDELSPVCDCCAGGPSTLTFTTGVGSGVCGQAQNFRCADDPNAPCLTAADCPVGPCIEVIGSGLPRDLDCGGLYTGGGGNSVPLPIQIPDQATYVMSVTSCVGAAVGLGATTASDTGTNRTCTEGKKCSGNNASCVLDSDCPASQTCQDRCFFGPPLPIPNATSVPTSVCSVNVIQNDAVGVVACNDGDTTTSVPLAGKVFLTGDLLKAATPPNVPGIQPCPLCVRQCVGGANDNFPCDDNSDCASGICGGATECLGGLDSGDPCTPANSPLTASLPTSHDCTIDPLLDVTASIGGLPIAFAAITGTDVRSAVTNATNAEGVFCGFCRDTTNGGSLCFEGDTSVSCPAAIPAATGLGFACDSNADCTDGDSYETCSQRTAGAFSRPATTRLTLAGSTDGQCLEDFGPHDVTLAYLFCIPPTFDGIIDAAGDLPGPGAASLVGTQQLQ